MTVRTGPRPPGLGRWGEPTARECTRAAGSALTSETTFVLAGTPERVIDFAGLAKFRPDEGPDENGDGEPDGLMVFRLPVGGTTSVEEARSLHDGERVADKSGYIHSDLRSSVVAKTAYSGPAQLDREAEYGAWGETRSVSSNSAPTHQFVDTEPDAATGYHYFGARVYDPSLKRWLSPDPLMWNKPEVEAKDGRELNLYSYVKNNPVRHTDPKGLSTVGPDSLGDWIGVFFGVGGSQHPQIKKGTLELPGSGVIKGFRFLNWAKHADTAGDAARAVRGGRGVESSADTVRNADELIRWAKPDTPRSLKPAAARYEAQVGGNMSKLEPLVDGVFFDGVQNGKLVEAKGPGYTSFLNDAGKKEDWARAWSNMLDQFERQARAAKKTDLDYVITFAEKDVMKVAKDMLRDAELLKHVDEVKHVKPK